MLIGSHIYHKKPSRLLSSSRCRIKGDSLFFLYIAMIITLYYLRAKIGSGRQRNMLSKCKDSKPILLLGVSFILLLLYFPLKFSVIQADLACNCLRSNN